MFYNKISMFHINKKIVKDVVKIHYKNVNLIKNIIPNLINCKNCSGRGYIYKDKNGKEKICKKCSGLGINYYTYF